jgi:TetR/AcrR family transcriptional repressor of mexJK operon
MKPVTTRRPAHASERRRTHDETVAARTDARSDREGAGQADDQRRAARKRRAILEAATTLFLRQGYQGTSMDEVAALAAVSKQTVYKHFADKERLFSAITLEVTATAEEFIRAAPQLLQDTHDLAQALHALARRYLMAVMQPRVLQLRRLIIAEAGRFPDLARTYYERVPERVLATLATALQQLAERGLLHVDDGLLAANHFAFLVIGPPLDKAMFCGDDHFTPADLDGFATAGVRAFLAAYGARAERAASPRRGPTRRSGQRAP